MKLCLRKASNLFGFGLLSIFFAKRKVILGIRISFERTMLVAEQFLNLWQIKKMGSINKISTDGGTGIFSQVCGFLKIEYHLHSSYEKSIIERTIQYIKDRTEILDDYFICNRDGCKLKHMDNWLSLFADYHNKELGP